MWLTRASCAAKEFLSIGRISSMSYHRLGFVIIFNRAQPQQRIEKQWATGSRLTCYYQMFCNWACYSRRTREINPPTWILTAIDREFSSLSSSLRTTSFFSVRLQSLWKKRKEQERGRERKKISGMTNTMWAHLHDTLQHLGMKSMADKAALTAATFYFYSSLFFLWSAGMIIIRTGNIQESSMTAKEVSLQSREQLNNQTLLYSAWCPSSSRKNLRLHVDGWCKQSAAKSGFILSALWANSSWKVTWHRCFDKTKCSQMSLVSPVSACCCNTFKWTQRFMWLTAICSL